MSTYEIGLGVCVQPKRSSTNINKAFAAINGPIGDRQTEDESA